MSSGEPSPAAVRGARRREQTRTTVLDAAERLMVTLPPAEIRIEQVAEGSGVSVASIYVHFGNKDGLIAAVLERLLQVAGDTLARAYAAAERPFDQIIATGLAYLDLLLDRPALAVHLTLSGMTEPTSETARLVSQRMDALRQQFEDRIRASIEAGEIAPIDAHSMSYFLFGAWNGVASFALRRDQLALSRDEVFAAVRTASRAMAVGITRPRK